MTYQSLQKLDIQMNKHNRYDILRPVYEQRQYGRNHVTQRIKRERENMFRAAGEPMKYGCDRVNKYAWFNYQPENLEIGSVNQSVGFSSRSVNLYFKQHET